MRITRHNQAANTRTKLAALEAHYEAAKSRDMGNPTANEAVLFSLRRMINS